MSTRKKNAVSTRPKKTRPADPPSPPPAIDIAALLMIGEERIHPDREENDNVYFMSELIDSM